jgi:ATP-dependent Clp protease ATP-binding subunit ClpA
MRRMGMSDDDLEQLNEGMQEAFGEGGMFNGMLDQDSNDEEDSVDGPMFPFLKNLFSHSAPDGRAAPNHDAERPKPQELPHPHQHPPSDAKRKRNKFLETYCVSLTRRAEEGSLDTVIGRDIETERLIQILNRRTKNNPCLIGEPGVGKTAIAEGLAQRIVSGEIPFKLRDKQVLLLDMTAMVAGTQFRGQFEARMKTLIDNVRSEGNVILVIDEIHTLVGAGDADGAMNAANILKPALSRGEIQVIGATTFNEYRKHIERDSALERRFQPINVSEPSIEDSIEIIKGIAHYYEEYHGVQISDSTARQAVLLSERYITDRYLPDKAIDLIDEAASALNLCDFHSARMEEIRKELDDLRKESEYLLAVNGSDDTYKRLADIHTMELRLSGEFDGLAHSSRPELTVEGLAKVIEQWTKIPASSINEDEFEKLSKLDQRLKSYLIGQDEAIETVCAAIRRNRIGISAKRKPVSFIFVGSTGVGKTELVKRLSGDLFDSPDALIRFDMSEFMEKHTSSRLVGSPPGYVGYDEAGQLTEKIRRRPYSVILFDEIEKAHPDVLNVLLQILDDGRLTDSHGRIVSFENTVIIMTTNAGSDKKDGSVGFNRSVSEQGKEKAERALKDFLRPEFLNRVDEVVYFNKLSEEDFVKIAGIMMQELRDNMAERNMALTFDLRLLEYLAKKSYSMTYGARNLRRLIQKEVEDGITSVIVFNYASPIHQLMVTAENEHVEVRTDSPALLPESSSLSG